MTLSRMFTISNSCLEEVTFLTNRHCGPKYVRNFRRIRNSVEETKVNTQSLATPFTNLAVDTRNLNFRKIIKPFLFTLGFSGASFVGAAIWEYENIRYHASHMIKKPMKFFENTLNHGNEYKNDIRNELREWWKGLTPGEKVFVPICAANVLIFLFWKVPKFQLFMMKYFCSNPASHYVCIPMVLSTFSHYSGLHILANMYVLHSFSTGAVHSLGQEQFIGLYLSAGVISSFTSYLYKIVTKQPGLSLGASGAIMAILSYVCTHHPDTRLGIILLPIFTFSAGAAIKFIVGLDITGVLLRWKFFDHAAHLGGAAWGICWALWGNELIWKKREPILRYWHEFRGSIK